MGQPLRVTPVAMFLTVTETFAMGAPEGSVTTPVKVAPTT